MFERGDLVEGCFLVEGCIGIVIKKKNGDNLVWVRWHDGRTSWETPADLKLRARA